MTLYDNISKIDMVIKIWKSSTRSNFTVNCHITDDLLLKEMRLKCSPTSLWLTLTAWICLVDIKFAFLSSLTWLPWHKNFTVHNKENTGKTFWKKFYHYIEITCKTFWKQLLGQLHNFRCEHCILKDSHSKISPTHFRNMWFNFFIAPG